MVDLLLVPLDRIVDYKNLLDKLYEYADKIHAMNYRFLGEAAKNLSKIATAIEAEKYDISNKNESRNLAAIFGTAQFATVFWTHAIDGRQTLSLKQHAAAIYVKAL